MFQWSFHTAACVTCWLADLIPRKCLVPFMSRPSWFTARRLSLWSLTAIFICSQHLHEAAAARIPQTKSSPSPSPNSSASPQASPTASSSPSKADSAATSEKPKVVSTHTRRAEDVAGPVVRAVIADRVEEMAANLTADGEIPNRKSIAQMIEQALEQEFPEEKKETIGKNYNETAKSLDVSSLLLPCLSNPYLTFNACNSSTMHAILPRRAQRHCPSPLPAQSPDRDVSSIHLPLDHHSAAQLWQKLDTRTLVNAVRGQDGCHQSRSTRPEEV